MKLFDYIFLTRPMLIIPVWTIALLGARAAEWRSRGTDPFILDQYPFVDFSPDARQMLLMLAMKGRRVKGQLCATRAWAPLAATVFIVLLWAACGGGGGGGSNPPPPTGTPAGSYTITVTATSGGLPRSSFILTLTVN